MTTQDLDAIDREMACEIEHDQPLTGAEWIRGDRR